MVLAWSVPGGTIAVVVVGVVELVRERRRKQRGTPLTATYINEFTAMFYGTKRMELDHRASTSMLRVEDDDGAPPRVEVDLAGNRVVLRGGSGSGQPSG